METRVRDPKTAKLTDLPHRLWVQNPGLRSPRETRRRAAERRQRSRDLGVALHEATVVIGQPGEAPHLGARRRRRPLCLEISLELCLP
jgi:hypothetical protein